MAAPAQRFCARKGAAATATLIMCAALATALYVSLLWPPVNPIERAASPSLFRRGPRFQDELGLRLNDAADENKTVIITWANGAWAKPGSILDLFLESFRVGNGTAQLLNHVLIIAADVKAMRRCRQIHPHCYRLRTAADYSAEEVFMSADYVSMMWRRLALFGDVLGRGYSYVFTDADIMWLRNPFPVFRAHARSDIQVACDRYSGRADDLAANMANAGFMYVRSTERTGAFLRTWRRYRSAFPPGTNEQDVLNAIKVKELPAHGVVATFLDTREFGGYCQRGSHVDELVRTMHANCCKGLSAKLHDLRNTLADWGNYSALRRPRPWSPPSACRDSWHHH